LYTLAAGAVTKHDMFVSRLWPIESLFTASCALFHLSTTFCTKWTTIQTMLVLSISYFVLHYNATTETRRALVRVHHASWCESRLIFLALNYSV